MTSAKPGRNDPCPCGSGKKYKKCCGRDASPLMESIFPERERTGTPMDAYIGLLPLFAFLENRTIEFEPDGSELKEILKTYKKRYRPGEEGGLLDSHYVSWEFFDLRFGPTRRTIAERALDDPSIQAGLDDPGLTLMGHLAASYATFYEVLDDGPEVLVLGELGTGRHWHVYHYRELFPDTPPGKGEIWYTRLIGPPERALSYTTPYVYEPETRDQFKRGVEGMATDFRNDNLSIGVPEERLFAESQKQSALFWAEYIHTANNPAAERPSPVPGESLGRLPLHVVNTDHDELVFTEMHFKVKDEAAVRKRLTGLKTFDYDAADGSWAWLKAPSRKYPDEPRVSLGVIRLKDGILVAETNSRERAARLEWKLVGHFGELIKLEKAYYRDPEDMPRLSPEEAEKERRENEEFNARPEVQEALRKQKERYYFEKFPSTKVPALGNITPLSAMKTEAGRKKLADLLDFFDRRQDAEPDQPRVDFDKLRHRLGLPARSH